MLQNRTTSTNLLSILFHRLRQHAYRCPQNLAAFVTKQIGTIYSIMRAGAGTGQNNSKLLTTSHKPMTKADPGPMIQTYQAL